MRLRSPHIYFTHWQDFTETQESFFRNDNIPKIIGVINCTVIPILKLVCLHERLHFRVIKIMTGRKNENETQFLGKNIV